MSFENSPMPSRQESFISAEQFGNKILNASEDVRHNEELAFHAKTAKYAALSNMSMVTKHAGEALLKFVADKAETQPENISGAYSHYKNILVVLATQAGLEVKKLLQSFNKTAGEKIGQDNIMTPAA